MTRKMKGVIALIAIVTLAVAAWAYYDYRSVHPNTADAYVGMHVIRLAPQVSGVVQIVAVRNHQAVSAGDLLLTIDPAPFQIAVDQAQARLQAAKDTRAAGAADVTAAQAQVDAARASYIEAKQHAQRILTLAAQGTASQDQADAATAAERTARQGVHTAESRLKAAQATLGDKEQVNAEVKVAEATLAKARLDLSYTRITAPTAGVIGNFDIRPGAFVPTGQPLMALVDTNEVWVDANYKETDLSVIKPGQHATVTVDMLPDKTFDGVVQSLSPASGAAFSLLPPENATGNWVKVTQRFPVRIKLNTTADQLRIGASASVTVNAVGD